MPGASASRAISRRQSDQAVVERMDDKGQAALAAARGKRGDDPPTASRRSSNGECARIWKSVCSCNGTRKYDPGCFLQAPLRRGGRARGQELPRAATRSTRHIREPGGRRCDSGKADRAAVRTPSPNCRRCRTERSARTACETAARAPAREIRRRARGSLPVTRKPRIGRHPVVFEREPIRPHIAESVAITAMPRARASSAATM